VSSVFTTLALLREKEVIADHCGANGCDSRAHAASSSAQTWNTVATSTAIGGFLGLGVGAYFLLFDKAPRRKDKTSAATHAPTVRAEIGFTRAAAVTVDIRF